MEHSTTQNIPNNQIWYTSANGNVVTPNETYVFGATIKSNTYSNGKGVITFDGNVTMIGEGAFKNCDSLTSVNIPDSVTSIGEAAFADCTSLTSVNIPDSVNTIGEGAFYNCSSLTSVNIPDSVTEIGKSTFRSCTSLTEFTGKFTEDNGRILVIDGVLTAFAHAGITEYTIPDSVTTIGDAAFADCSSLTSVNIPDSVTTIGDHAFVRCNSLTSVNIPDSVTTIGNYAFEYCSSLTSVNIPDSVTSIGNGAFGYCYRLTSVYCKATTPPELGGTSVFDDNGSGRRIYVYEECVELYKSAWSSYMDSIYTNGQNCPDTTIIEYTTNDGNTIASSKLPIISNIYENGIGTLVFSGKEIPSSAFHECTSLTSVNIGNSVTTIGDHAFVRCNSLTSVNIPDSVTTIGEYAFAFCDSLTSVNIPDSVTTIGDSAFIECTSLTRVTIGDSVTEIGYEAFAYCTSLTEFTGKFAEDNGRILVVDGVLTAFTPAGITEYNIPDSVTEIRQGAFYYCTSLTSVTIGDSVTTIGGFAFAYCDSLTSVNIPDSVTTIGMHAFASCDSLTSVNIPDSVTTIGNAAFAYCKSLTSVTIPDSVTTIGNQAFQFCSSLKSVYCKATTPPSLGGTYGFNVFDDNGSGRKIYVPAESVEAYKSATNWSEYRYTIVGYDFENGVVVE